MKERPDLVLVLLQWSMGKDQGVRAGRGAGAYPPGQGAPSWGTHGRLSGAVWSLGAGHDGVPGALAFYRRNGPISPPRSHTRPPLGPVHQSGAACVTGAAAVQLHYNPLFKNPPSLSKYDLWWIWRSDSWLALLETGSRLFCHLPSPVQYFIGRVGLHFLKVPLWARSTSR